jgi:protocatechuate 3,4-dioxygenase alpha subunit
MVYLERDNFVPEDVSGERITIRGKVFDGDRKVVPDAVLEIWQSDPAGQYASELPAQSSGSRRFTGFGRVETNDEGEFQFTTLKPGRVQSPDRPAQAPHIVITLFSRGLLKPLHTRIYFPDQPGNAEDPVLRLVPVDRRSTLIATPSGEQNGQKVWYWNIVMQGEGETVFFDY